LLGLVLTVWRWRRHRHQMQQLRAQLGSPDPNARYKRRDNKKLGIEPEQRHLHRV
jgi:hypothetical protein